MVNISLRARKRALAVTAIAGVALTSVVVATPAHAGATPTGATGTTVLVIGGPAVNTLQAGGCGPLAVTGNNGATTSQTAKSQWRLTLKINGVSVNGNGGIVLTHQGSISLSNTCYDITLAALRITNFGDAGQFTTFDLNAVQHSADDTGRSVIGTIDLTNAQFSFSGNKVRIAKENLYLSSEGAQEFNELATGFDTGPFTDGMKVGNGKTTVVFAY